MYSRFILLFGFIFLLASCKDDDDYREIRIDFQDVVFSEEQNYIENAGSGMDGVFKNDIVSFPNYYNEGYKSWQGFAYSRMHNVTTPGYENQYSVYDPTDKPDNAFMVAYVSDPVDYRINKISLTFSQPVWDLRFDVANSTFAALAMKTGYFTASPFESGDEFKLMVYALNAAGKILGTAEIMLAEGSNIGNRWTTIDAFGNVSDISKLEFELSSTDINAGSEMNTPAYFCLDNLSAKTLK